MLRFARRRKPKNSLNYPLFLGGVAMQYQGADPKVSTFFVIAYISVRQPIPHCESLWIKGDAQAEG